MSHCKIDSALGPIYFIVKDNTLLKLGFSPLSPETAKLGCSSIGTRVEAYLRGELIKLDLPHQLIATPFQKKVLQALQQIPLEQALTYKRLADSIDSHPRAIGQALARNPLPMIYPCHRVLASTGIGGFCGKSHLLNIKKALLARDKQCLLMLAVKAL